MILLGAIKDPIRKMIPGTPVYLALATVPVWGGMLLGAFKNHRQLWSMFKGSYRRLSTAMVIFLTSLVPAAFISATYGSGSWKLTLLGLFSYSSLLVGLVLGYIYPRNMEDLRRVLVFYCLVTTIMLIGTPLEYLGVTEGWDALGTAALKGKWIHYGVYGHVIKLVSGFYRSPDLMGWHAALMSMFAVLLALRSGGTQRQFWIAIAGWGLLGVMLCGRRKIVFMLPVFATVLSWTYWRMQRQPHLKHLLTIVLLSVWVGYFLYQNIGPSSAIERYYFDNPQNVLGRVEAHGYRSLLTTYRQSGFFGEGLGTATQGAHHLTASRPRTWQEGSPGRILVELGVPGFLCFMFLSFSLVTAIWRLRKRGVDPHSPEFTLYAGLFAIFVANVVSFMVSHQILGDPFAVCFFGLLIGFILSAARLTATNTDAVGLYDGHQVKGVSPALSRPPKRFQFFKPFNHF
jgi:hypothetical protein